MGTGSVPASGDSTNVTFTIEEASSVTWLWERQVKIVVDVINGFASGRTEVWTVSNDGMVDFPFTIPREPFTWSLAGDDGRAVVDFDLNVIRVPASEPCTLVLEFTVVKRWDLVGNGELPIAWNADTEWWVVADSTAEDGYSIRSGEIGTSASCELQATIEGPGWLTFDWRIDSARGNYARFRQDGTEVANITRSTDWAMVTVALEDGMHDLRWIYEKGSGATAGEDAAFLDNVSWTPLTLAAALGDTNLIWTTDGDVPWFPQISVSSDGKGSAQSGSVIGESVSRLATTVTGAGTLTWKWKADVEGIAGVDVYLDGENLYDTGLFLEGWSWWVSENLVIEGEGEHTVVFEFWNVGSSQWNIYDCAYLDCVSWTPAVPPIVEAEGVSIPLSYFDTDYPELLVAHNGNYETAALATAANGVNKVWECYVAGISPVAETARFEASITMDENGKPHVEWNPPLSTEEAAKREYRILGAETLDTPEPWTDVTDIPDLDAAGYRFFKVKVRMKE